MTHSGKEVPLSRSSKGECGSEAFPKRSSISVTKLVIARTGNKDYWLVPLPSNSQAKSCSNLDHDDGINNCEFLQMRNKKHLLGSAANLFRAER